MPVFNPPLGRETTIPLSSSDHDRFVHLSFTLAFELGEDASGSWELWTDIPDVDNDGHLVTGPGEWRAVPFAPIPSTPINGSQASNSDASNKEGLVITLPPALTTPALPIDHTLIAEMVVPANNASYFYTHRRVVGSGETHWLGNGGDNGVVRVLECEATSKHVERKEWKGIGIELRENESPIIHHLPIDDSTNASILLLQSVPPVIQPTHQLLVSPKKSETHTPESLVIVSNELQPVSIQRNSTGPVAAGLQEHHDRHRSFSEILSEVCKDKKVEVIKNTPEGIVAFVYRSRPETPAAYLVAHNTLGRRGELAIPLSSAGGKSERPLAIKEVSPTSQGARYISPDDSKCVTIDRSSDTASSSLVFQVAQFITLPGKDDSSYMIAAGDALSQSIAEKSHRVEHTSADNAAKQNKDVDEYLNNASSSTLDPSRTLEEAATLATHPTPQLSELPELIADDGESIESGSESPISGPIKPVSFLSWLKRFFVGFWSWLFGPFGSKKAGQGGDDKPGSGTVTPNERTHLLSSPQTSAATSSTAVSPFGSPEVGKVKAELAKIEYPQSTRPAQQTFAPAFDNETSHVTHEALFTFAKTPFRFFFPPHTYTPNTLSLEYKGGATTSWVKAAIPQGVETKGGFCDEVTVEVGDLGEDDDKTLWEARWSVL